jgi:AraC family transcriptional regulator
MESIYIKNMVCSRCIMVVKAELEKLDIQPLNILLGEVQLLNMPAPAKLRQFAARLDELGFEMLDDVKQKQIEKIKSLLIQKAQSGSIEEHFSISNFLVQNIHRDYSHISKLFSSVEGITIEQYFILQKIEKVKELLVYGQMNLSEIAFQLGYSSLSHLSAQFKKVTGLTPGNFKKIGGPLRNTLDKV